VRILIDACLPVELKTLLEGSEVKTAREIGWQQLDNGELLEKASGLFDVLLTVDKSMPSQRIIARCAVAVLVVKAVSNRIADLTPLVPQIQAAIQNCQPGVAISLPQ
jgi:predicted nuclease of predicted toxin-antitoxin system